MSELLHEFVKWLEAIRIRLVEPLLDEIVGAIRHPLGQLALSAVIVHFLLGLSDNQLLRLIAGLYEAIVGTILIARLVRSTLR